MQLKGIFFSLIVCLVTFYVVVPYGTDYTIITALLFIVFIALILFLFTRQEKIFFLKGQFLKHSTFALISIIIVHFQYYLDYILGNADFNNWKMWVNHLMVNQSITLAVIGLLSFLLGYISYKRISVKDKDASKERVLNTNLLFYLSIISLAIYFATANPLYLAGFYGAEQLGEEATYAILAFNLLIFAIIIQNSRNMIVSGKRPANFREYIRYQGYLVTILIVIYLISVMISGDRGPLMTFSLCYVAGYFFVTKKKLQIKYGFLLILGAASFFTLLGQIRSLDKGLSFNEKVASSFQSESRFYEKSISPATQELASSIRALHTSVNYVPEEHNFLFGRFQLVQVLNAIPFFSYFTPLLFTDNSLKYNGSAKFITWINQGDFPTKGDGTTCIADFYFDFGVWGVIFGMFFFGYLIRFCEVVFYTANLPGLFLQTLSFIYLINAFYIGRASVLVHLRTAIWVFVILLLNKHFINRRQ